MDKALTKEIREYLFQADGLMVPFEELYTVINVRRARPIPSEDLHSQLNDMKARGWVEQEQDEFQTLKYFLTDGGKIQRRRM